MLGGGNEMMFISVEVEEKEGQNRTE